MYLVVDPCCALKYYPSIEECQKVKDMEVSDAFFLLFPDLIYLLCLKFTLILHGQYLDYFQKTLARFVKTMKQKHHCSCAVQRHIACIECYLCRKFIEDLSFLLTLQDA